MCVYRGVVVDNFWLILSFDYVFPIVLINLHKYNYSALGQKLNVYICVYISNITIKRFKKNFTRNVVVSAQT